jgi:hypothetical protein
MDGSPPSISPIKFHSHVATDARSGSTGVFPCAGRLLQVRRNATLALFGWLLVGLAFATTGLADPEGTARVNLSAQSVGLPPPDFEFGQTGVGEPGRWTVIADPTALAGLAIEHISKDEHEDRFPLAIYKWPHSENFEVAARFKIIAGTLRTAGIAVGLRNADNYYAVSASAFEKRVDLLLVANGKVARLEGTDAQVEQDHWHALGVKVSDDHLTVMFDQKALFTAFDRTRAKQGKVALWTREDNITRFDQMQFRSLEK